jgi:protein SCO1/2
VRRLLSAACLVATALAATAAPGWGHGEKALPAKVGFDQRLGARVPMELVFRDEAGRPRSLAEAAAGKPAVLVLLYYKCTMLCPLILDGLGRVVQGLGFEPGREFSILTVSINPRETPEQAAAKKAETLDRQGRHDLGRGWRFLTGDAPAIQALTDAVGFRYEYDARQDEYAHAAGLVLLTPDGRIGRYLYGMDYTPRDLRLGLVEAAEGRIGSPVDQLLLLCYHYDPVIGRYGFVIMNVLRAAGVATVALVGGFVLVMLRREQRTRPAGAGG